MEQARPHFLGRRRNYQKPADNPYSWTHPEGKYPELGQRFAGRAHAVDRRPGFECFRLWILALLVAGGGLAVLLLYRYIEKTMSTYCYRHFTVNAKLGGAPG
ncbi:hypothetical protein [Arthrobacter sp. efr-133-TYG-104]|uniref:hypothetical protein n=1 Tax=Arthrobacter sp. efr-133-TYG-104 TaxID=3040324 RepID=UPI00254F5F51|nr:hypothetical protein [Arthrobacter sp. efr-133-TYG-104]